MNTKKSFFNWYLSINLLLKITIAIVMGSIVGVLLIVLEVDNLLQKSSPLKLLGQIKPNLATVIIGVSSLNIVFGDLAIQSRWPPWQKIEHKGKMYILAYNSETKAFRANLTWGKIVY